MTKILIIEDEKLLAEMYSDKFSQAGYKVILAYDAEEGLTAVEKKRPEMIILDIRLPREGGIEFLKKLRADAEIAATPVIAFSNYDVPEVRKEAAGLGVKEYLIKTNYTPKELLDKVKEYLPS